MRVSMYVYLIEAAHSSTPIRTGIYTCTRKHTHSHTHRHTYIYTRAPVVEEDLDGVMHMRMNGRELALCKRTGLPTDDDSINSIDFSLLLKIPGNTITTGLSLCLSLCILRCVCVYMLHRESCHSVCT